MKDAKGHGSDARGESSFQGLQDRLANFRPPATHGAKRHGQGGGGGGGAGGGGSSGGGGRFGGGTVAGLRRNVRDRSAGHYSAGMVQAVASLFGASVPGAQQKEFDARQELAQKSMQARGSAH